MINPPRGAGLLIVNVYGRNGPARTLDSGPVNDSSAHPVSSRAGIRTSLAALSALPFTVALNEYSVVLRNFAGR